MPEVNAHLKHVCRFQVVWGDILVVSEALGSTNREKVGLRAG
jgi:hypothetical protein